MQITTVFWNIHKRPEAFESLTRLTSKHDAQIVLVAEMPKPDEPGLNGNPTGVLLDALNRSAPSRSFTKFRLISAPQGQGQNTDTDAVQVFSRLSTAIRWKRIATHKRYTIWKITIPGHRTFHLAAAHFTSLQNDQGDGQRECAVALRTDLEQAERKLHPSKDTYKNLDPLSIVIGDLNANPFDPGIVSVYGLNATGLRSTAQEGFREHQGREYPYLYNPMWPFLNTDSPDSFYKRIDAPVRFDWFLLDQVLVRPGCMELFGKKQDPDLRLLTHDGIEDLIKGPNKTLKEGISDHLPLLFRFDLPSLKE